jgi:hypothetical protein
LFLNPGFLQRVVELIDTALAGRTEPPQVED